jgi:hypothetical protein
VIKSKKNIKSTNLKSTGNIRSIINIKNTESTENIQKKKINKTALCRI